jgi:Putative adhesin
MSIKPPSGRSAAYRLPGVFALALLGGGGIWTAHRAEQDHRSTSVFTPAARTLLWLHAGSADIVVSRGTGKGIRIERDARWVGSRPTPAFKDDGRKIDFDDSCHDVVDMAASMFAFHDPCAVTYRVKVPAGQTLRIEAGSGDIVVTGMTGRIMASTGSGDVNVGNSGRVVALSSGSGDISATFRHAPVALRATAGSGDVTLRVPAGGYRITASTGSGDRSLDGISDDRGSTHSIYARTGSGDVSIGRSDR